VKILEENDVTDDSSLETNLKELNDIGEDINEDE
jgi:hypothetical protein